MQKMRKSAVSELVGSSLSSDKPIWVICDASASGIGAIYGGHSVQISDGYVDNMMTLYHLRHPSGHPPDDT
jgi:hypothetical protein